MKNIIGKLNVKFALFVLFAVASVAAPLSIIWKYENTLRHGTQFKLRTKPVDPYDAFRGRYVSLAFEDDWVERIQSGENADADERGGARSSGSDFLYVRLATGADGFAKPVAASRTRLAGDDVVTVERWYRNSDRNTQWKGWRVSFPFDRYYLPEDIAPAAEELYWEANRQVNIAREQNEKAGKTQKEVYEAETAAREAQKIPAYVTVRVRNGVGVLEELYLNGVPVREAVRARVGEMGKGKK